MTSSTIVVVNSADVYIDASRAGASVDFHLEFVEDLSTQSADDGGYEYQTPSLVDPANISLAVLGDGSSLSQTSAPAGLQGHQMGAHRSHFTMDYSYDSSGLGTPATFDCTLVYGGATVSFVLAL